MARRARLVVWLPFLVLIAVTGALFLEADLDRSQLDLPDLPRTTEVYEGQGAWIDAFDYAPAYQDGGEPPLDPKVVTELADAGVRTLYIQAARDDERSPDRIVDEERLGQFLVRAHLVGIRVVGWYLPTFTDIDEDLANLLAIRSFRAYGERFDGLAVDIEFTEGVPDVADRNDRLVDLSRRLRLETDGEALGAIVLPPVLFETVNRDFWPRFPWRRLAASYDVWLPMSYWTDRRSDSGFRDGYTYNTENTNRIRAHLRDPEALVHGIGGIGDAVDPESLQAFARSLGETRAVGGSIYDWASLTPENREAFAEAYAAP